MIKVAMGGLEPQRETGYESVRYACTHCQVSIFDANSQLLFSNLFTGLCFWSFNSRFQWLSFFAWCIAWSCNHTVSLAYEGPRRNHRGPLVILVLQGK